jgi:hypothetical protein
MIDTLVDKDLTAKVVAALSDGSDEPVPDVDECPKCGMSFIEVSEGAGLTFPIKVACRCTTCEHEWERIDE